MKQLLIMRHAKSDWSNSAQSDFERPLNERGKKAAPHMGQQLIKKKLVPDYIITSAAARAQETCDAVAEVCLIPDNKIERLRELYDGYIEEVSAEIRKTDNEINRLLIVGHNPTWMNLVTHFSGSYTELKTAEICVLEFPGDNWADINKNSCKFAEKISPKGIDN